MRYEIDADFKKLNQLHKTSDPIFMQTELFDFSCKLHIEFSFKSKISHYDNNLVRMYLFLYEIKMFLDDLEQKSQATWFLGYAPFANGIFQDGRIFISSRRGKDFFSNVYGVIEADEISNLRKRIGNDMSRFDPSKASKI